MGDQMEDMGGAQNDDEFDVEKPVKKTGLALKLMIAFALGAALPWLLYLAWPGSVTIKLAQLSGLACFFYLMFFTVPTKK